MTIDVSKLASGNSTLLALDTEMEMAQDTKPRPYLGGSAIGDPCERKLWFSFRWYKTITFEAATLRKFDDGHRTEDLMAERLRMISGVHLDTHDEVTGKQFGFVEIDGHFRGHADGFIIGIKEAPNSRHVWEHKAVGDSVYKKVQKAIKDHGEKAALEKWNDVYFGQAQIYMKLFDCKRHFMTVTTAGGRDHLSLRTEYNPTYADHLMQKAANIIGSDSPPPRISNDRTFWKCKWCDYTDICHGEEAPEINCRTCVYSYASERATWACEKFSRVLDRADQEAACNCHETIPKPE
jgi:CRISPR/Cas system-associated exonuclease Cas4 (RecB family)